MIPARFAPILFGFILSCLMSGIVSAIATWRVLDADIAFFPNWIGSWISSWMVAFPTVLVVAPIARRLVGKLTRPD
ncbi:DUF2798 domain-containing protein [Octadecabacter sp. CECT 8868]|uniref:DUF2798 domain-containing protein n=1 Tax=Octadecabacter algicola TaxID=2909342 RepID=UPI001F15DE92|nr:DUF2798 domain-containing protein [Octadecabacter algicola]MCF2903449.1 DUF2798 domain-containing protein [Octadecabacter algicola]